MDEYWHTKLSTVSVLLFAWVILAFVSFVAYRSGIKAQANKNINPSDMIPSSILGLLALILGFTFSMAIERFEARRHLAIKEANSINTAYLRSTLLKPVPGIDLNQHFKDYVALRILFYDASTNQEMTKKILMQENLIKEKLWAHLKEEVKIERGALQSAYVFALTEMFDAEDERNFAINRNLPVIIYLLILLLSAVTIGSFYFDRGYNNEQVHWRPILLIVIFGLMIAFIHDLDHPRDGLVRIGQEAMIDVQKSIL